MYSSISSTLKPAVTVSQSFLTDVNSGDNTAALALMSPAAQADISSDRLTQLASVTKVSGTFNIRTKTVETNNSNQAAVLIGNYSTPVSPNQAFLRIILVKSGNDWLVNSLKFAPTQAELDINATPTPTPSI